ncbi:MAG: hydrolase TatD [Desulfobulbus propionicus]|nr:MAG: hydrolase TatD [Desulfobulbus propionicus]
MSIKKEHYYALPSGVELVDTHCHLDMKAYADDLEGVLADAEKKGVKRIITIGIDLASSQKAVELARTYPQVYACVGIHPHEAQKVTAETLKKIEVLAKNSGKVVGYGEIGLDYAKCYSPAACQKRVFRKQLLLAKMLELPVVIHDREAHDDTYTFLKEISALPSGGVMHCFSGNLAFAEKIISLGMYISIPGIVTFNKAAELQEVARTIRLDRLLLETDGPFLSPAPFRGRRNTPDKIIYTASKIAELRNISMEELGEQTTRNAEKLFNLSRNSSRIAHRSAT